MKAVAKFEFPTVRTRASQYPWETIFDGNTYRLEQGEDYECKTGSFDLIIKQNARKHNKNVKTAKVDGGTAIVVQAEDMTEEEQANNAEWLENERVKRNVAKEKAKAKAESNGHVETPKTTPKAQPAKAATGKGGKK